MPRIKELPYHNRFSAMGLCAYLMFVMACSSANSEAPAPDQVHEPRYIVNHAVEADAELDRCKTCHGNALNGKNTVPSCLTCHENTQPFQVHALPYSNPSDHGAVARNSQANCLTCHGTAPNRFDGGVVSDPDLYNIGSANCSATACHPDAGAHPTRWQGENDITGDYLSSHRSTTAEAIKVSCALCHQVFEGGSQPLPKAPSCFTAGFTNSDNSTTGCHPGGFAPEHGLPYTDPTDHGASAKADLADCQSCHGETGTINFNGGTAATSCSSQACHPDAGAHPTNWAGNDSSGYISTHTNAGKTSSTCTICHDVTQGRTAPNSAAPSCFSTDFTNANGVSTGCHPGGIIPDHGLPYTDPTDHGASAKADLADCQSCHGETGTINFNDGTAPTSCSSQACHPDAGAHPTNWAGNDSSGYISTHTNAGKTSSTCTICHDVTQGRTAPNNAAPSCFSTNFTNADGVTTGCHPGGVTPDHGLPYTDPTDHGASAKADLADCQSCHGETGTINFNGGTAPTSCSSQACHPDAGAHPTNWAANDSSGYISTHTNAGRTSSTCTICHDVTFGNPIPNSAAPSCFSNNFTNADGVTTGCHAPDHPLPFTDSSDHGSPARSSLAGCQSCHGETGTINFNGGTAPTACSSCHTAAGAHPDSWRGRHDNAGDRRNSCSICHGYDRNDASPNTNAPSCYASSFNGSGCHSNGP